MRIPFYVYLIIGVVIVGILALLGATRGTSEPTFRVDDLTGKAIVQPESGEGEQQVTLDQKLKVGDKITTGPGCELDLAWPNKSHVRLAENTTFEVTKAFLNSAEKTFYSETKLSSGKVWIRLRRGLEDIRRFTVDTPFVTTIVRGTIYSVEVKPDDSVRVETFEGEVGIKRDKEGSLLKEYQYAEYKKGTPFPRPTVMNRDQVNVWMKHAEVTGAFLSVDQPKDNIKSEDVLLVVSGYTDPGNVVKINDINTPTDKVGKWSSRIELKKGKNLITVTANDEEGRQNTIVRTILH